ncbi:MAG: hypothetical protein Q9M26_09005 [Mariprofundales bacterium]|nr:hypothetical protein [Mariprofundales bacterium]
MAAYALAGGRASSAFTTTIAMMVVVIILATGCGMLFNLTLDAVAYQPDWGAALLIAAVAAKRGRWPWVLPLLMIHDMVLYWVPWPWCAMMTVLGLILVIWCDVHLGTALPQRVLLIVIALLPMTWQRWPGPDIVLTLLLTITLWYLVRIRSKVLPPDGKPVTAL